jgi:hypothetical protein
MSKQEAIKQMATEFIEKLEDRDSTITSLAMEAIPNFMPMVARVDEDLWRRLRTAYLNRKATPTHG